jgi:hypothetical protein
MITTKGFLMTVLLTDKSYYEIASTCKTGQIEATDIISLVSVIFIFIFDSQLSPTIAPPHPNLSVFAK